MSIPFASFQNLSQSALEKSGLPLEKLTSKQTIEAYERWIDSFWEDVLGI